MESIVTMAEATEATPPHRSLPDEVVIWEILIRLPPKSLLRCRVVCPAWRHATSTRDFLLAHHARQPTLPLTCGYHQKYVDIVPFDHRAGVADQLPSVARIDSALFNLEASCDGLLVLTDHRNRFSICNPATRQYAPLEQLDDFRQLDEVTLLGMYPHSPTGEYRLLGKWLEDNNEDGSYAFVFTLGSSQPPRRILYPGVWEHAGPVLFHGALHWYTYQMIVVFDTTSESFRWMCPPVVSGGADLFEIGGMLGLSGFNVEATIMDIWVMRDYKGEVWEFKRRVEFPVAKLTARFQGNWHAVAPYWDGDVFALVKVGEWLLQIDINGKLVASFHRKGLHITPHWLKQTLVMHSFFPTLEGYIVNQSPFI